MEAFSLTDTGRVRRSNQDYVYVNVQPVGMLPNLFLVADGMGGHKAGDYASRYTVETIVDELSGLQGDCRDDLMVAEVLRRSVETANARVFERAGEDPSMAGMGTTLVAAVVRDHQLTVCNVGDSRLYIDDAGELRQITRDHSLVEELVRAGAITREASRTHPDKNIITRAVGVGEKVEPDFFNLSLKSGDLVLMCTDGLTNMLEDGEIHALLREPGELSGKAHRLVEAANDSGGRDNISVILLETP